MAIDRIGHLLQLQPPSQRVRQVAFSRRLSALSKQNFRNLKVWQKAHQLRLDIHRQTKNYPKDELFGLIGQTRRAAGSIGANLAEGCGRGADADFKRFVQIALGSACEVENHLLVGRDLSYMPEDVYNTLETQIFDIKKMLSGLLKKLGQKADS